MSTKVVLLVVSLLVSASAAAQQAVDPAGVWNLKVGTRVVLIEVTGAGQALTAKVSGTRRDMRPADKVSLSGRTLSVEYADYRYVLEISGDTAKGTALGPGGTEPFTAVRQQTRMLGGDTAAPALRTWWGLAGARAHGAPPQTEPDAGAWLKANAPKAADLELVAWRTTDDGSKPDPALGTNSLRLINAEAFEPELRRLAGRAIIVSGYWKVDAIEITKIEPAPYRPQ